MDEATVAPKENPVFDSAELSARLEREEPGYMARWQAVETLLGDDDVCADKELFDKLSRLQDAWQRRTLARHGVTLT